MLGSLFGQKIVAQPQELPPEQAGDKVVGSSMNAQKRMDLSVLSRLDARTNALLSHAEEEARKTKQQSIEISHIFLGLLFDADIFKLVEQAGANPAETQRLRRSVGRRHPGNRRSGRRPADGSRPGNPVASLCHWYRWRRRH